MNLRELIAVLENADQQQVVVSGFHRPHSYRGYYEDLAFEPAENVRVADMLADARRSLGATFEGYKGGEFTMHEYTTVWLAHYGETGETLGAELLSYMLARCPACQAKDEVLRRALEAIEEAAGWVGQISLGYKRRVDLLAASAQAIRKELDCD